eukprot:7382054-Prymnesium_polylepis.2
MTRTTSMSSSCCPRAPSDNLTWAPSSCSIGERDLIVSSIFEDIRHHLLKPPLIFRLNLRLTVCLCSRLRAARCRQIARGARTSSVPMRRTGLRRPVSMI